MNIATHSVADSRRFWGVPTEELQLDLSMWRQTARDVSEDVTLADSMRRHSLDYINAVAGPIAAELSRRKEQRARFTNTPLADPWPAAGGNNALIERAHRLKAAVSLSSYIIERFPNSDLHQTGHNTWKGRCIFPDHDDSDPSMVIYGDRRFTCFGCDRHGDIFQAIAVAENLQRFGNLVDALARWAGEGQ